MATPVKVKAVQPPRERQKLPSATRGAAVMESDSTTQKPGKRPNKRSRALEEPADLQMFPAGALVDNLLNNKTLGNKRLIFRQSVIGIRGMRQYQYEIEDSGQCVWAYRPLGFWQGA